MRTEHPWAIAALVCFVAISVVACRRGEPPFLVVQFCLTKAAGPDELKRVLQQIARDERMEFTDRSADTEEELRAQEDAVPNAAKQSFPIINVNVQRGDVGLGGGNLGLGPNQVALGFGRDTPAARAFANRTVTRLQRTWKLMRVPNDRGAYPLNGCA